MAKFQSPLLGYNNNVRHKNRVFHIQTEDSGVNHPHIITHLFMDGGRILKSVKTSYAEHVGDQAMQEIVRGLMKEQHKAIFIALRDGQFDTLVDGGAAAPARAAAAPALPTSPLAVDPPPSVELSPATVDETKRPASNLPPPSATEMLSPRIATLAPPPFDPDDVPTTTRQPPMERLDTATAGASTSKLTINLDQVEEAQGAVAAPSFFHAEELPPPPKSLFVKEPGTGAYRTVAPSAPQASAGRDAREEPGRYAPARPAAIFASRSRPQPAVSLFGDELVSDKSLDEVILGYLAEDLEPSRRK